MRAVVIFYNDRDYTRTVLDYIEDIRRQTGHEFEALDPETRAGDDFAKAYEIVEYPTVMFLEDDGRVSFQKTGLPLPLINEVEYYFSVGN
ncbi:MAG: hypothetical protein LBE03_02350 [Candidatus Nomurabacteria bacterium]|jgi:hypothetical protein|nr:hypothetical protein [Candidatus Nomurabacteria bacterium]